jgi:hypothetical protein
MTRAEVIAADGARVAARIAAARTDAGMLLAAYALEEISALAYADVARALLRGRLRAVALRFAGHERDQAATIETQLAALTVLVARHAGPADRDALLPGLLEGSAAEAIARLAGLEAASMAAYAAIAGRVEQVEVLPTLAAVAAGAGQHAVALRSESGEPLVQTAFVTGS